MTVYIGECARSTAEYLNGTPLGYGTGNLLLLAAVIVLAFLLVLHFAGGVKYRWSRDVRIGVYGYATTLLLLYLYEVRTQPRRSQIAHELCTVETSNSIPIRPYRPGAPAEEPVGVAAQPTQQPSFQPIQQPIQQPTMQITQPTFQPTQPAQQTMMQPSQTMMQPIQQPTYQNQ